MNKAKKVLKIILIVALTLCFGALIVWYIIDKQATLDFVNGIYDFLNKPLPIVGVTTFAILLFIWKLVITTNYGKKKVAIYEQKQKDLEQEHEKFVSDANKTIMELKNENLVLNGYIVHICELSTNKKLKDYGKELLGYGKETNIETTTE